MKRKTWWILAGFGVFILVCGCLPIKPAAWLVFGWLHVLLVTVPRMTVEPAAVAVGVVSLVLLAAIAHGFAGWLYAHAHRNQTPRPAWRLRWTVVIVPIVVLLFATGICLIVVIHQIVWLATAKEPFYKRAARHSRMMSEENLMQIGQAARNYEQDEHHFPPGGTFDQYGNPLHSWETMLLPNLDSPRHPDMALPWNHPQNAQHFKMDVREFLNPGVNGPTHGSEGYGLSHYAANARVMGADHPMRKEDITDGLSHTIMAGEVKENFRPWGDPVNWRDPALGVQKSPDGFAGPWANGGTQFLMMDGSVRRVNKDINPAVLRALATPNGGEPVPDDFDQ